MSEDLKPCPTCGNNDAVELLDINDFLFWVSCARCGLETRMVENKSNAIWLWNKRADDGQRKSR